jgi:antitoxin (DNA-binding transcriptional repressor) of toxin-antitoxin stability system
MDTVPTLTQTIDVHEAQQRLPELVSLVIAGTEVILSEGPTPLVRLVPVTGPRPARVAGLHTGAITTSEDFDAPLPDEFWLGTL